MRLRTQEDFVDAISTEISWRNRELTELKQLVQRSDGASFRQVTVIRAAIALLYAHWEGFIKKVAEDYLNYVGMQRLTNGELSSCMLAVVVRAQLSAAERSKKVEMHIGLVDYMRTKETVRARLPYKNIIRTDSNLSSKGLLEILTTLGISSDKYAAKSKLIDSQLLGKRNNIAHGNDLEVDADEYLDLHEQIAELLRTFRNDVENAVATSAFARPIQPSK